MCLQLILFGKLLAIVVLSGAYCCADDELLAFPTAFPSLFVPLASNFATQNPFNSVPPKLNAGCTIAVLLVSVDSSVVYITPSEPSFVLPFKNVTSIFFSSAIL